MQRNGASLQETATGAADICVLLIWQKLARSSLANSVLKLG